MITKVCERCGGEYNTWPSHSQKRRFCSPSCSSLWRGEVKFERGTADSRVSKRILIAKYGHQCRICGAREWRGQPVPLVLDHIDGNAENNDPANLRIVCPNCDAQLPTYKSRNRGKGRHSRRERYRAGKSY